jgi:HD superfamily phosphohydrolase
MTGSHHPFSHLHESLMQQAHEITKEVVTESHSPEEDGLLGDEECLEVEDILLG